jgi:BolA protein
MTESPEDPSASPLVAEIRAALVRELAPTSIEIFDDSSRHAGHAGAREGGHFRVTLVSSAFQGRPQLERHRLVYAAVAPLMGRGIHALNIVARTPQEIS